MKKIGVVVARFQIDTLHEGHRDLLRQVAQGSDVLCVVLGTTENLGSRRNPLDFVTRKLAVEAACREERIAIPLVILAIQDHSSNEAWSARLDSLLLQAFPGDKFNLYGGRDSFLKAYCGTLPTAWLKLERETSSTERRERVGIVPLASQLFRKGVIYGAQNQWPRLFMCVDVAPISPDKKTLFLGKRRDEKLCRFPGGFVDQKDPSLEAAARREAYEEAGVDSETLQFVTSFIVPDYRYSTPDDGLIMSAFFIAWNMTSRSRAGDDLDELIEVNLDELTNEQMLSLVLPAHQQHMAALLKVLPGRKIT